MRAMGIKGTGVSGSAKVVFRSLGGQHCRVIAVVGSAASKAEIVAILGNAVIEQHYSAKRRVADGLFIFVLQEVSQL